MKAYFLKISDMIACFPTALQRMLFIGMILRTNLEPDQTGLIT